ncbi:MAG: filamentous hemagglutinin N-terminal domain-containing protein [Leptolyngbyaceae cyanobacterium SL_1_1]|nr:filamentous hemagglutinin N-terminal domain-containing protein [Leptolyngbyaceae cyanobacterium RM1_1_2]NJO11334.1 filamentous hemagglutinin N-terminal domain-containing protein [Leptolyngbyaceae cyanobacterium SL_1_1]
MKRVPQHLLNPILFAVGVTVLLPPDALSQVLPDASLGTETSIVTPDVLIDGRSAERIDGGAVRGTNLFHSFLEFSVNNGQQVYFANPVGIDTILSRVTGSSPSEILGTLGVAGSADLFLLNPNGILFGPEARLDISGSFFASTASAVTFADGSEFSATQPQNPLLSISVLPGVQPGIQAVGNLTNQGSLAVGAGETLTLWGDTTTNTGSLSAPGGTVQLLGNTLNLIEATHIDVSSDTGGGAVLVGGDYPRRDTVPTARQVTVGPGATISADARTSGNGGRVIIWAEEIANVAGTLTAKGGAIAGNGGLIETSSGQSLSLNFANVPQASAPHGTAGLWLIDPTDITIVESISPSPPFLSGTPLTNTANTILASDITTALEEGSSVTITTNIGGTEAGDIMLDAPLLATLFAGSGSQELRLEASNNIILNQTIEVSSFEPVLNVFLNADNNIVLNSGSVIRNSNLGSRASNVTLQAGNSILLSNSSVDASTTSGIAGSVELRAGSEISLSAASAINTSSSGGTAGNISLQADTLVLSNASLLSEAEDSVGGNIALHLERLLLIRQGSQISTLATGTALDRSDGNISITAPIVVAVPLENSDIIARASQGGNVAIDAAGGIYGFTIQDTLDPRSDPSNNITATGQVVIEIPDVDPNRGLIELPASLADATDQIAQGCGSTSNTAAQQQGRFVITGRGGLPLQPGDAIAADAVSVPWVSPPPTRLDQGPERSIETEDELRSAAAPALPQLDFQGLCIRELNPEVTGTTDGL